MMQPPLPRFEPLRKSLAVSATSPLYIYNMYIREMEAKGYQPPTFAEANEGRLPKRAYEL